MATAPPTVTYTSVAEVCTHLRNGARRLLRKVPELELAAQNGHCAMFASMSICWNKSSAPPGSLASLDSLHCYDWMKKW